MANAKNEKMKRSYFEWLRNAKGYSESTIVAKERDISRWEELNKYEDFGRFTAKKAVEFKRRMEAIEQDGKQLSANTRHHCLQNLRSFFQWLSTQPGYKSKITAEAISYLTLDKKTVQALNSPTLVKFPPLEYIQKLADSIQPDSAIGQRDRALVAFLFLSGMRDKAVATLPLGCFDVQKLEIRQLPLDGVETKFGKSIITHLVKFDDQLVEYVVDWAKCLTVEKCFGSTDPLFPRTKLVQAADGYVFEQQGVEPVFWRGTGAIRQILRERAEAADLGYYYPHSFRHAHVHLALKHVQNAEQLRAISQNLGHDHIATTLTSYGKLDHFRVAEVLQELDFSAEPDDTQIEADAKTLERILRKIRKKA